MQKICVNIDDVMAAVAPKPVVLKIDGREHAVRELSFGEVLILERLGKAGDDDQVMVEHLRGMFVDPPPFLDELKRVSQTLGNYRQVVAQELNVPEAASIGTAEAYAAFGRSLPDSIADFPAVERRYVQLVNIFNIIIYTIGKSLSETTPGNVMKAAMPLIDSQVSPPTDSDDSQR